MKKLKLSTNQLIAKQPVKELGFKSTDDLDNYIGILGQERATGAIELGVAMHRSGYNIYVMGDSGTGRMSYMRKSLESQAEQQSPSDDWAYVNNFDNTREPKVIQLPSGMGHQLLKDFESFIDKLLMTFPAAFENPTYQQRKSASDC